jgi:hypothetical protein
MRDGEAVPQREEAVRPVPQDIYVDGIGFGLEDEMILEIFELINLCVIIGDFHVP